MRGCALDRPHADSLADRAGRTRYSMVETIHQFAEEQLVGTGEATEVRDAHARQFAWVRPTWSPKS